MLSYVETLTKHEKNVRLLEIMTNACLSGLMACLVVNIYVQLALIR
jgi:hypothetical protein